MNLVNIPNDVPLVKEVLTQDANKLSVFHLSRGAGKHTLPQETQVLR